MNKTKYILIVGVALLSLVLWGGHSFAEDNAWATLHGSLAGGTSDTLDAGWLIGHVVYDPMYYGSMGQITDVLVDRCNGRMAFVLLSDAPRFRPESNFESHFGSRTDFVAVPFGALERTGFNTFILSFRGNLRDESLAFANDPNADLIHNWREGEFGRFIDMNKDIVALNTVPATIDFAWADNVYRAYGLTPYWTEGQISSPEIVSYQMSGRYDEFAIHFPDGRIIASYGAAPYWTSCGSCGESEAMNYKDMAAPPLPSNASPGECFARFFVPPRCETVTEQVMVRAASERVETIPAKYEMVSEQVMVKPASKMTEEIPAEYKTVEEQVLVEAAHTEWRPGKGAKGEDTMCLVEIPAAYKTVSKQVLVKPASTREIEIPAQYETRQVSKMVEPSHENHIQIPAEYKTVTKTQKVADGYFEWRNVECCK